MWVVVDLGVSAVWGVVSTVLLVMTWTLFVCALLHLAGVVSGRVHRAANLVGFVLLLLGGGLCELLQWGGDRLVFDVLRFVSTPRAGAVFLASRVLTVIISVVPVLRLIGMTWRRAFVPGIVEAEGIYEPSSRE